MSRPQQQQQQQQRQASTVAFAPGADWILLSQGAEARVWKVPHFRQKNTTSTTEATVVVAICKERFSKSYRHRDLDERLTKQRCRTEARLLEKCATTLDVPKVLRVENTNYMYPEPALLYLEYVDGTTVRDYLEDTVLATNRHKHNNTTTITTLLPKLAESMGSMIAQLHAGGMVHGDLTTSNMMLRREIVLEQSPAADATSTSLPIITLIDFGLAKNTTSAEERAVDLYVLERALQSTHPTLPASFWETVLKVYASTTTTTKEAKASKSKSKSTNRRGGTAPQPSDATLARLEQVRQRGRKRECFG